MKNTRAHFFLLVCLCIMTLLFPLQGSSRKHTNEVIMDENNIANNAKTLQEGYKKGYPIPEWHVNYINKHFNTYHECCKSVVIYTLNPEKDKKNIKSLYEKREPYNTKNKDNYHKNTPNKFEYKQSFYRSYYENHDKNNKKLAPLCITGFKTPIILDNNKNKHLLTHMISVPAPNFSDVEQPDYKHYINNATKQVYTSETTKDAFNNHLKNSMRAIFQYAIDHGITTIVMSKFGCEKEVFLAAYDKDAKNTFFKDYWLPAFQEVFNQYKGSLKNAGVKEISFIMEHVQHGQGISQLKNLFNNQKEKNQEKQFSYSFYTHNKETHFKIDARDFQSIDKTLFVCPSNPNTMFGNGNEQDHSLQGTFGSISMGALLTCPHTNPHLTENIKQIKKKPENVNPNTEKQKKANKPSTSWYMHYLPSKKAIAYTGYGLTVILVVLFFAVKYAWFPKLTH